MKNLFVLLLVIICWAGSFAQTTHPGTVAGSLTDSLTSGPIPYANVVLLLADKLFTGTTTDATGAFVLANLPYGRYTMAFSYVGYTSKKLHIIVSQDKPVQQLGAVVLSAESKTLTEVTVTSRKALVEDKGDRLVYNAEKDISNAAGMAADVLRKVPMLSVDLHGNLQMRGSGNIKVLINGKPSAMMARNLTEALRQMPAHIIKSVEVITSPGARYDAEGSAGVINIITKKPLKGFSGGANGNAGNLGQGVGINLMVKTKKIGLSTSASAYQYRSISENEFTRTTLSGGEPLHTLTQQSLSDNTGLGAYGDLSLDYDPDSTSRINLTASTWGGNFPNNSTVINRLTNPEGETQQELWNDIRYANPYRNAQLDVGYTKTFKKPEHEFSLLTQLGITPNTYAYTSDQFSSDELIFSRQRSTNNSRNKEYTIQTDYVYPFWVKSLRDTTSVKLEIGAKAILRDMGTLFRVEESQEGTGELIEDPSQANDFDYFQQVYAGYTSLQLTSQRTWSLIAGLRLEHTDNAGDFITTQTSLRNNYNNFIPGFTITKSIKAHSLKASYNQRIQRPLIWYLNPWLNESNPKNTSTGNPYLDPELSHAIEFAHSLNTDGGLSLYSALYWKSTNNAIENLTTVDTNGVSLSQPRNIAGRQVYGLNVYVSTQLTDQLYLNGGGDLHYLYLHSLALGQSNKGMVWNTYLDCTYSFAGNYTLQANGTYTSAQISLQGHSSAFYWYGFSARRQLWKKKGSVTLTGNNVFGRGVRQKGEQSAPTFYSRFTSLAINRSVQLSFEWRFGRGDDTRRERKKIKNEDKSGQ